MTVDDEGSAQDAGGQRLAGLSEAEARGRVLRRAWRGATIRWEVAGFTDEWFGRRVGRWAYEDRTGLDGNGYVVLARLDDGAPTCPPGTVAAWAKGTLPDDWELEPQEPDAVTASPEQMRARAMLEERYGGARIAPSSDLLPGSLRIEGLYAPDSVAARWIVPGDGRVGEAWDPDGLLDRYLAEVEARRRRRGA